jgi:hypothetical protein
MREAEDERTKADALHHAAHPHGLPFPLPHRQF